MKSIFFPRNLYPVVKFGEDGNRKDIKPYFFNETPVII